MHTTLIVIDGPAGVGKGYQAHKLAESLGFRYVDSGLMYRAVGVIAQVLGQDPMLVARELKIEDLQRQNLRSVDAGKAASIVAAIPAVREAVNVRLREFTSEPPGCVMDGRDGAREFPEAQVKIFLWATVEECAKRRCAQYLALGTEIDYAVVLNDLIERNKRDTEREVAKLLHTPDAEYVDSTELDKEATFSLLLGICLRKLHTTALDSADRSLDEDVSQED